MTNLTVPNEYKQRVLNALFEARELFGNNDYNFATKFGINSSVYSQLKTAGKPIDNLIKDSQWINIGRKLNISLTQNSWKMARTEVFTQIEQEITFCKENSKAMIFVDDCEIGKTFTAQYLSKTLPNCFYVDCSQARSKHSLIRALGKCLGVDGGSVVEIKERIKYTLSCGLPKPIVILDEAGDLDKSAFLEVKELWNGTTGTCGWYMMGADGLKARIERGIHYQQVGFREIFSRFSSNYSRVTPTNPEERKRFYKNLIQTVLKANCEDSGKIPVLVNKCMTHNNSNTANSNGGLRRAESLLILSEKN